MSGKNQPCAASRSASNAAWKNETVCSHWNITGTDLRLINSPVNSRLRRLMSAPNHYTCARSADEKREEDALVEHDERADEARDARALARDREQEDDGRRGEVEEHEREHELPERRHLWHEPDPRVDDAPEHDRRDDAQRQDVEQDLGREVRERRVVPVGSVIPNQSPTPKLGGKPQKRRRTARA